MPKLWTETVEAHRVAVRDATLDTTAALVAEEGLAAVTMSQIAKRTGIGRATLYKYFPDVESILLAWHERQISAHLDQLESIRDRTTGTPTRRLEAVLLGFARHSQHQHDSGIAAMLHRGGHLASAQRRLHQLVADLIAQAAADGDLRDDVPAVELASYCLHALTAAGDSTSHAAVRRLVTITLTGMRPAATNARR